MNRLPDGHFYIDKLGRDSRIDDAKRIENLMTFTTKLKSDKTTLKRRLQETRHNNGVYKKMVEELKMKNEAIENQLQESKTEIKNGNIEIEMMKKSLEESKKINEDLLVKTEELEEENEKLKVNQSKLTSDLESFKSTDADLIISQQETKECNEDLEAEMKKNLQCESDKKSCENELEAEVEKNEDLRNQNSEYLKSLEESRSTSSANQKLAQECQDHLEDEIEEKEGLKSKFEYVCPSWSEWSDCSKTCWGIKTRIDRCSMHDDQINSCNQDSSCSRSGKFQDIAQPFRNSNRKVSEVTVLLSFDYGQC